jgi:hypothetical protein
MNARLRRVTALEQERTDTLDPRTDGDYVSFGGALVAALQVQEDARRRGEPLPGVATLIGGCMGRDAAEVNRLFLHWLSLSPPNIRAFIDRHVRRLEDAGLDHEPDDAGNDDGADGHA